MISHFQKSLLAAILLYLFRIYSTLTVFSSGGVAVLMTLMRYIPRGILYSDNVILGVVVTECYGRQTTSLQNSSHEHSLGEVELYQYVVVVSGSASEIHFHDGVGHRRWIALKITGNGWVM